MPTCWIFAGPNGAGKTTFALNYLAKLSNNANFINADLIAAGISPLSPERKLLTASRIFLSELEKCVIDRNDFAFETTLSGRTYLRFINRLHADGWAVVLIYLALPNVALSINRVAERVSRGGHNIPKRDIVRRFPRSLKLLLNEYCHIVDECLCYMNHENPPKLVFVQQGIDQYIIDEYIFQILEKIGK
ncbi:MAG: zeta toxin family protein [Rhodobacteraceae bacterium]|nr:zeta toxin family protein [Paracoccaceae bacterium]